MLAAPPAGWGCQMDRQGVVRFAQSASLGLLVLAILWGSDTAQSGSGSVSGAAFVVSHDGDAGAGSLRWAIESANATPNRERPDRILFAIPGPGPHVLRPLMELPALREAVIIDGFSQTGSYPAQEGGSRAEIRIAIDGAQAGKAAHGIVLAGGGSTLRGLEIVGFDGDAIRIEKPGGNALQGNRIEGGITLVDSPENRIGGLTAGDANEITGGDRSGVRVLGRGAWGNAILGNSILSRGERGIALVDERGPDSAATAVDPLDADKGPNDLQNAPVLVSAANLADDDGRRVRIEGRLESVPLEIFRLELFASARRGPRDPVHRHALGERLLAAKTVTTGADGSTVFVVTVPGSLPPDEEITATATDPLGNTSEFSFPVTAALAVIQWNNASGGNWSLAANWSPAQVPGAADQAQITLAGTYAVTVDVNAQVAGLTLGGASGTQTLTVGSGLVLGGASTIGANGALQLSGGTLDGAGDLTAGGPITWTSGSMTGTGRTIVNATLALSGAQ